MFLRIQLAVCCQCARRLSTESPGSRFVCILFSDRFSRFVYHFASLHLLEVSIGSGEMYGDEEV